MTDEHRRNREVILSRIEAHPGISNQELSAILGWTINRVTPRTRELLDEGRIKVIGTKRTKYNRSTRCYAVEEADACPN